MSRNYLCDALNLLHYLKTKLEFFARCDRVATMRPIGKLNKWLLTCIFWLIATVLSLILLIVFFGRESIFLQSGPLALIPFARVVDC